MKSLLRALLLPLALLLAVPASSEAQTKIPPGTYSLVPDATFNVDFDVSSVVIEFTENTMTATAGGTILVKSSFTIAGDMMTITDLEGQVACPSVSKYKVTISEKGIRVTPVEDPCAERSSVLAQVTFVKMG